MSVTPTKTYSRSFPSLDLFGNNFSQADFLWGWILVTLLDTTFSCKWLRFLASQVRLCASATKRDTASKRLRWMQMADPKRNTSSTCPHKSLIPRPPTKRLDLSKDEGGGAGMAGGDRLRGEKGNYTLSTIIDRYCNIRAVQFAAITFARTKFTSLVFRAAITPPPRYRCKSQTRINIYR